MKGESPLIELRTFLAESGLADATLTPIKSGRNSRVWLVVGDADKFIVKEYFRRPDDPRDRLGTEFAFLTLLQSHGIKNVPRPIHREEGGDRALYQFLPGIPVAQISDEHIHAASEFILRVNSTEIKSDAKSIAPAADACFSPRQHCDGVLARLHALDESVVNQRDLTIYGEAYDFLERRLRPMFQTRLEQLYAIFPSHEIQSEFDSNNRILSPSDFGFHNMLIDNERIYFLDFEYAGWDDVVKLICDFICQPQRPVSKRQGILFRDFLTAISAEMEFANRWVDALLPIHRIKWCCILLNEFKSADYNRRMHAGIASNGLLKEQLHKAKLYFNEHLTGFV